MWFAVCLIALTWWWKERWESMRTPKRLQLSTTSTISDSLIVWLLVISKFLRSEMLMTLVLAAFSSISLSWDHFEHSFIRFCPILGGWKDSCVAEFAVILQSDVERGKYDVVSYACFIVEAVSNWSVSTNITRKVGISMFHMMTDY